MPQSIKKKTQNMLALEKPNQHSCYMFSNYWWTKECSTTFVPIRDWAHTTVPTHVCAQTNLCPDTFVPRRVCAQTRLCPDMFVPRHVCALTHVCGQARLLFRHVCTQTHLCPDMIVPRHDCAHTIKLIHDCA